MSYPLLKTQKGFLKRTPWVNKLILLKKVREVRMHRKTAMGSHQDTVPKSAQVIMAEEFIMRSHIHEEIERDIPVLLSTMLWHGTHQIMMWRLLSV